MFGDLSTCIWTVPIGDDAFRFAECETTILAGGYVVRQPCLVWRRGGLEKQYRPIDAKESLYRTLAAVDQSPDGILDFAGKYGRLGISVETMGTLPDGHCELVEPLFDWCFVAAQLAQAIWLWDLTERKDIKALSHVIRWRQGEVDFLESDNVRRLNEEYYRLSEGWQEVPAYVLTDTPNLVAKNRKPIAPDDGAEFTPGNVIEPALCVVSRIVNGYLRKTTQPALLWDSKKKAMVLRYVPCGLLGAIFLQFATSILSGRTTQICPVCGRYYEVTAQASRNDRLTCSNRCRVRAYRDRQQRAQDLHATGRTVKQIAKEIGSDVSTIKTWLNKKKG